MLADDLLAGAKAISEYTGLTERQVYHLAEANRIPVFRLGQKLFGRKSELDRAFSADRAA